MTQPQRTALICGISGQDGSYLARLLLQQGYRVVGTSRDAQISSFGNLFNHESPLLPERFVTQKIVRATRRIAAVRELAH